MPIEAMIGEVYCAADEPARPRDAPAQVQQCVIGPEELNAKILDHRLPEPRDVGGRATDQLMVSGDPVRTHEPGDVRSLDNPLGRIPDVGCRHEFSNRLESH